MSRRAIKELNAFKTSKASDQPALTRSLKKIFAGLDHKKFTNLQRIALARLHEHTYLLNS